MFLLSEWILYNVHIIQKMWINYFFWSCAEKLFLKDVLSILPCRARNPSAPKIDMVSIWLTGSYKDGVKCIKKGQQDKKPFISEVVGVLWPWSELQYSLTGCLDMAEAQFMATKVTDGAMSLFVTG